jgi:integrase
MRLTAQTVREIRVPAGKTEITVIDDRLPGFGLRVRASGAQTWIVAYRAANGLNRRVVLGAVAELGPAQAFVRDVLAKVRLGADPVGEKQDARDRARETFGASLDRYLTSKRAKLAPRSMDELDRFFFRQSYFASWHGKPLTAIDRRTIATRLGELASECGNGASNRARAALSGYLGWCMREGLLDANPVPSTNKQPENGARSRVLTDAELAKIWEAAGGAGQYGRIVRLLLLTAGRRAEIGDLRWSEVNLDTGLITLPPNRVKAGRTHFIPLPPAALAIIQAQPKRDGRDPIFGRRRNGFWGWSRSKANLKVDVTDWNLHDFRRCFSTFSNEHGAEPHLVEAALGHTLGGIAAVYNKATHLPARRRLLERWADHIAEIVDGKKPATVVKLRK